MKLFVLGLDGTTFNQLDPLIVDGLLPNIKEFKDKFVSGEMETIMPPVTGPAWLALASGLNPGKTGVFDYINRSSSNLNQMIPLSSKAYENRACWQLLNKKGFKTGIFNYPTLVPAPKVDGFVVGGIGARDSDEDLCYPRELINEIRNLRKNYKVLLNLRNRKYEKNIDLFFEDIDQILTDQSIILKHLVKNKEWDFIFAVLSVTDWMQHVVWKYIDEKHPLYMKHDAEKIKVKYKEFWRKIDGLIGELFDILPDDINFMIVSDHGFGPLNSVFYPNSWLEKKGWLKKKRGMKIKKILADNLKFLVESFDNKYSNALTYQIKKILKLDSAIDLVDLNNSLAYSPEHNTMFGCINLTDAGRKQKGFKESLIKELKNLPQEFKDIRSIDVILPEDVYNGPFINASPDIFFIVNDYEATIEIPFDKRIFSNMPSVLLRTGSHRSNGIFMAKGKIFKNISIQPSILDIAPTILALFGLDIPGNLDGKVLKECLHEEFLSTLDIKTSEGIDADIETKSEEADVEKMKDMLKSLGYL